MKISYLSLITILIATVFSFYKYYWASNYDFIIEFPCNPDSEYCKYRPCDTNPKRCLPNNLSYYKAYTIKAYDFKYCDNDCQTQCNSGKITCLPYE